MGMKFEELDDITRGYMLQSFDAEESNPAPYRGRALSRAGQDAFPQIMNDALRAGNEETLQSALAVSHNWKASETYVRAGVARERKINIAQASERLALTEFNTWYVRGLCLRLIDESVDLCQTYRAADPKWEPAECSEHEGQVFSVSEVLGGHRARYWPEPGDPHAISIPFGPSCHHSIRRISTAS